MVYKLWSVIFQQAFTAPRTASRRTVSGPPTHRSRSAPPPAEAAGPPGNPGSRRRRGHASGARSLGLDTLGDHAHAAGLGLLDGGGQNRLIAANSVDLLHQFLVQLQAGERQIQQLRQTRNGRTHIVDRDAVTKSAQPLQRLTQRREIVHRTAFGQFDDDTVGVEAGGLTLPLQPLQRRRVQQHVQREVHRHPQIATREKRSGQVGERPRRHQLGQFGRKPGILDLRHETVRQQGAAQRMIEPRQRLQPDRMPIGHADDGLVAGFDHRAMQRSAQFRQVHRGPSRGGGARHQGRHHGSGRCFKDCSTEWDGRLADPRTSMPDCRASRPRQRAGKFIEQPLRIVYGRQGEGNAMLCQPAASARRGHRVTSPPPSPPRRGHLADHAALRLTSSRLNSGRQWRGRTNLAIR